MREGVSSGQEILSKRMQYSIRSVIIPSEDLELGDKIVLRKSIVDSLSSTQEK